MNGHDNEMQPASPENPIVLTATFALTFDGTEQPAVSARTRINGQPVEGQEYVLVLATTEEPIPLVRVTSAENALRIATALHRVANGLTRQAMEAARQQLLHAQAAQEGRPPPEAAPDKQDAPEASENTSGALG
jgi:hypothetical protein